MTITGMFIGWHDRGGRAEMVANALGFAYHPIKISGKDKLWRAPDRYARAAWRTLRLIHAHRPDVVMVTNPPIFCPLVAYAAQQVGWCRAVVIDSHTGAFLDPRWSRFVPIHRWLSRRVGLTVVHNTHQADLVDRWGVPWAESGFVPITTPASMGDAQSAVGHGALREPSPPYVLAVCSGGYDEPLAEIARAAELLPDVEIRLSGRPERMTDRLVAPLPPNLRVLGFLDTADYLEHVVNATVVLALTTRDATLVSGGFEAMAFGRPLVTSKTDALRAFFSAGTVFSDHAPHELAEAITAALSSADELAAEMVELGLSRHDQWADVEHSIRELVA